MESVRLDKWLWAARFFKTRSQAAAAIKAGKVAVASKTAKPSLMLTLGVEVELRKGPFRYQLVVTSLSDRRGNAERAQTLYKESSQSERARENIRNRLRVDRAMMPKGFSSSGRPTKKQRRELMALKEAYIKKKSTDDTH